MVSLAFAKLVATPTDTQWSQVYNAGNLFACLSLSKEPEDSETQLNQIGKDMFSHLESEFFTLENKNLQSIKEAIANTTHTIPSHVSADLCLSYFKDNVLYVFIYGRGTALMKRAGKAGVLLKEQTANSEIKSASGFLERDDIVVLQTYQFAKDMPMETISSSLDLSQPNDIAEALSPAMHEKDDGGQAAIIISYKKPPKAEEESGEEEGSTAQIQPEAFPNEEKSEETTLKEAIEEEKIENLALEHQPEPVNKPAFPKFHFPAFLSSLNVGALKKLDHRKKIFLSVAILIAVILVFSISLNHNQQEQSKTTSQFQQIYDPALKNYNDGVDLQSLNKDLARSDFLKSQKTLTDGKDKFKKGSKEEKQISELLVKVNSELGGATTAAKITPKAVSLGKNDLLSVEKENSGIAFAQDKDSVDILTDKAVVSVDKNGKTKDIIKNDKDWEKGVGLSTYQGNIYILDQKNGILKYTAGSDGFGKTSYFKTKPGNIDTAQAIAIDGSVWILFKDGTVMKFTKGESDGFKTKALDKPFKNPAKLFTNLDTENLYVLDNGNSRIVKLNKEGSFQTQYTADILKKAKDLEVSEKDGKILVLSGGNFYEIPL